jgi:uncharacterized membrane protein YfcA
MVWPDLLLLLLGIGVGTIGTLIGAGGGFILVPVLLFLYPDMQPDIITSISLAAVFMNAASGSLAYLKMKRVDIKSALIFALATLPGAIIGALATSHISRKFFDIMLGILLIVISTYLFINPKKKVALKNGSGHAHRLIVEKSGEAHKYSFNLLTGILISFFVGFFSSLLGIGGGIIHVPAMTSLLNFPVHIATATSHSVLAIMALAGTIVHIFQGHFSGHWVITILIGAGVIIGAQIGARISNKLKPHWIVRSLAIALMLVGIRLLLK